MLLSITVGHILGIGDRHTSNILVHTKTGELVHIDFGYVFEQAKVRASASHTISASCSKSYLTIRIFTISAVENS
jgi:hypothetical protein